MREKTVIFFDWYAKSRTAYHYWFFRKNNVLPLKTVIWDQVRLIHLCLPVHIKASSFSCHACTAWTRCQYGDLFAQASCGLCYFDVRVGTFLDAESIRTGHDKVCGTSFENLIVQIKTFVEHNPKEFIILSVEKCGFTLNDNHKIQVADWCRSLIGQYLRSLIDHWSCKLKTITVKDIWDHD